MENSSLKNKIEQYLHQQNEVFGDIVLSQKIEQIKSSEVMSKAKDVSKKNISSGKLPNITRNVNTISGNASTIVDENSVSTDWLGSSTLQVLNEKICNCLRCELGATRTKFVFGSGNPNADIVVIGEAPGADEDKQGFPFVGAAGQLLTKILAAVNFQRDEVYICNILKCRPPNNRTPDLTEVETCEPYLQKQLELIKPKFILALGLTAANTLLKQKAKMMDLRGSTHNYNGIPMVVTYHPAALLRNPNWKRTTWEDVQELRRMYDASK